MAIKYFNQLTKEEADLLYQTPALVTALIAGADDHIDDKEESWSKKLIQYRTFTAEAPLHAYYEEVNNRFESEFASLIAGWDTAKLEQVKASLAELNDILAKIDLTYATLLKDSWRSLARKIAEASGGILGFGGISKAEAALIDLPMIE